MNWDKLIGPATIVYLITITVGGVWWASDLSTRVKTVEDNAATFKFDVRGDINALRAADARITRLETLIGQVDRQLDRIETKLDRRVER